MSVYDAPAFDDHETVLFGKDRETGLQAIIAIHNTGLGPAVGGCRMCRIPTRRRRWKTRSGCHAA